MAEITVTKPNELSTDINVITAEINAYKQVAGEAIFEIGRRLKHVKENDLAHGEFGKWLESIELDRRRAAEFMKVYDELSVSNVRTFGQIGFRALYEIATLPPEQRTAPHVVPSTGATKTPDEMTVRELREVKAELKRTQEQRDAERRERERLEQAAQKEPEVRYETRTEYVEVKDAEIERRLQAYEERFGDIDNYSDRVRATNMNEVTTSVMTFSKAVRDLAKRHAYLIKYQSTVAALDPITKREYDEAVTALTELAEDFNYAGETPIIINQ